MGGGGFWEAPVQDGGHVFSCAEIPPECGFIEVDERVFAGLCGQGDEVGSQGRPGRCIGDVGYDLLGSVVASRLDVLLWSSPNSAKTNGI